MARRKIEDCPICRDQDLGQKAWYALQASRGEYKEVSAQLQSLDPALIRDHFQYHRIIQPSPQGNLRRDKALEKGQKATKRAQDIILLASRVPALSATQLAELFFWNGTAKQMSSARNACYRQLRYLLYSDFLYRLYPPAAARPAELGGGKGDAVSIYFLGRDGVPLVEEKEGWKLARRQWITRPEDTDEDWRLRQRQESNEIVASLARQIAQNPATSVQGLAGTLNFTPLNWYADKRMYWQWSDPVRGATRIYLSGLSALGVSFPERQASFLLPFTYLWDSASQSADSAANELVSYGLLERSDLLHQLLPEFPSGFIPPLLVVCRDAARAQDLRKAAQKAVMGSSNKPLVVVTDRTTFESYGLHGDCWISLWDTDATPRRHHLLTVLLQGIKGSLNLPADYRLNIRERASGGGEDKEGQ